MSTADEILILQKAAHVKLERVRARFAERVLRPSLESLHLDFMVQMFAIERADRVEKAMQMVDRILWPERAY